MGLWVFLNAEKERVCALENMEEVREDVWLCLACMQQFDWIEIAQQTRIKSNTLK